MSFGRLGMVHVHAGARKNLIKSLFPASFYVLWMVETT
jgi:hypothetical protein